MRTNLILLLTAGLGLAALPGAQAATPDVLIESAAGAWIPGFQMTIGTPFTVGASGKTITSLGYMDKDGDGLASPHKVGIYTLGQVLLGSVEVPAGTAAPYHNESRWATLGAPITLSANTTYMLAAEMFGDRAIQGSAFQATVGSSFVLGGAGLIGDNYANGLGFKYPAIDSGASSYYYGPNLEAGAPVPEPGTWAMMAVTAAGVGGYWLRRRRQGS